MDTSDNRTLSVCDFCYQEPVQITVDEDQNAVSAYYYVVPEESGDMVTLMSNLEYKFRLWTEIEHPVGGEWLYICENCFIDELS